MVKNLSKRIISLILIISIIFPILPIDEMIVYAEDSKVESIKVTRNYHDLSGKAQYSINIFGTGLSKSTAMYWDDELGKYVTLNRDSSSNDSFLQFSVETFVDIAELIVDGKKYSIIDADMPKITNISPRQVDITKDDEIIIEGFNLDRIGEANKTSMRIGITPITNEYIGNPNEIVLDQNFLGKIEAGNNTIAIQRIKNVGDVEIEIMSSYINILRVFRTIDLDPNTDVTIFPNRGKIGSQVTITVNNKSERYSIFFLTSETELFKYENLGENPQYNITADRSVITVNVPNGLEEGRTYKVFITNNLDNVKKQGLDLTSYVTQQLEIGEFYVVKDDYASKIISVEPNQGTSDGSDVTIRGVLFDELNIDKLTVGDDYIENWSVIKGGTNDPTRLRIIYKHEQMTYYDKKVVSATKDFLVTIGRDAVFEDEHLNKQVFKPGESEIDELYVRTRAIDPAELLSNPRRDVRIEITTTIKTKDGKTFVFTELAVLKDGYTFLPSYQLPTIINITPNLIEVDSNDNPKTKNTTIHSIEGQNFNVFRFNENGQVKTNYPKVVIGGIDETNAQIVIEKDYNGNVIYYIKDKENGGLKKVENIEGDTFFEVFDAYGNIVTGADGNQVGKYISFTIPKELEIEASVIGRSSAIAVANPRRDTSERIYYVWKENLVTFVTSRNIPIIDNVVPNIVTVDGGEDIVVTGSGFMEGIEVYIAGRKVEGVVRDIDSQTTKGVLRFKAPQGREGITILQVMNPDGGSATYPFIYVETLRIDPKITNITPPRGTAGDVIIIKGDNFLKSDLSVTNLQGIGMSKLIGTKVYLGNEEVNQYNEAVKNGELEPYKAPKIENEPLLIVERNPLTNIYELSLTPYYKEARISKDGKSYLITIDRDGFIVLIGDKITYTFNNNYTTEINATDGIKIYGVKQEENKLILESDDGERHEFTVEYDFSLFSVAKNTHGTNELKVASYYESIFLKDSNGTLYKITKDQLNRVSITDERENNYIIKNEGEQLVATKGTTAYTIRLEEDHVEIIEKGNDSGLKLYFVTPYYIDPNTNIITGHRVRVLSRNQIEIIIPEKQIAGYYDVKVENPDTKSDIVVKGFEYTKPQIKPLIYYIEPPEGSVDGGYYITIIGENFGENPEVRIDGVLVAAKDTHVNKEDFRSIKVLVPKYTGNIDTDFITDKKYVRVHVTSGGASTSRDDLFAYKLASSKPRITRINPTKGSTAGANIVEIIGTDFRFYEPYTGNPPKDGDSNYEDIDRDGKWTNYMAENIEEELEKIKVPLNDPTIKYYEYYYESPVLPSIYFGNNKAKIVEFERIPGTETYRILALAPSSSVAGTVDVYLKNNDAGQSPAVKYTYEASKPNIVSINTNTGRRTGGEIKDIIGSGYKGNQIRLIDENNKLINTTMFLVRFGEITNRNITDIEDSNYGLITGGQAIVEFKDSGLKVEINNSKLTLSLKESNKEYKGEYELSSGSVYINLKSLKSEDNTSYPGYELVKVEKADGRLLIDRGFAPEVKERTSGTLEVTIPSYYRATTVNVTIVNPDGVSNKVPFTYVNPGSRPTIINILRDGKEPSQADDGNTRVVQLRSKGGNEIKVIGTDFRPNATIYIGNNFLQIKPDFISETELVFTMPEVKDESKFNTWHVLTVVNEDRGEARSDRSTPTPIYLVITESESSPEISSLEPNKGPVTGGTIVTIKGKDFRNIMEGYEGENITVVFGDEEITAVTYNNYDSITVTAPSYHKTGPITVRVKNPDGTLSQAMTFTYISKPSIKSISPNKLFNNDTETVVTIKGSMFQQGLRVVVGAKLEDAKATDTVRYISGVKDGINIEKIVVGGLEARVIEFVSDEEIKVTFPETVNLENTNIIIINPDGGISEPYDKFKFEVPIPTKPLVLEAIAGYESTVQLIWSKSDESLFNKAEKYEIFGRKTTDSDNTFIGTTTAAEFLVKGLEAETQYTFMVRALNKYGASIDFATVTVKTLSLRQDDKLKEKTDKLNEEEKQLRENGKEEIVNVRYVITLGTRSFRSGAATVDLTLSKYKNQNKITISVPIEMARKDNRLTIKDGTMTAVINVRDLYTLQVSRLDKGDENAYIRIHLDKSTATHLPIGTKAASKAYDIYFDYFYGKNSTLKINQLLRNGLLFMEQDTLTYPNTRNTKIYILNVETGEYEPINSTTTDIKGSMNFVLLSER